MTDATPRARTRFSRLWAFRGDSGICGIATPAEGPTLEFVAAPDAPGAVRITLFPGHPGSLTAELLVGGRERAQCSSLASIRIWGRFGGARVRLAAAGPVRLVARTPQGEVLAGPLLVRPERPWATLQW